MIKITVDKKSLDIAIKKLIIEKKQYDNVINAVRITARKKETRPFIEFYDEINPGVLTLESVYVVNSIHTKIEIDCEIDEECVIVIDKKSLIQKIASAPKESKKINLIFDEEGYVTNSLQYKPDEFFKIQNTENLEKLFSVEIGKDIVSKIFNFCDINAVNESQKIELKGPLFEFSEEGLKLVSTDGHILIVEKFDVYTESFNFVFLTEVLNKILTSKNSIKISAFKNESPDKEKVLSDTAIFRIVFEIDDIVYEFDTGEKFPNYKNVIPPVETQNIKLVLNKERFSEILNKFSEIDDGICFRKILVFNLNTNSLQINFEHFNVDKLHSSINEVGEWSYDVIRGETYNDVRYCKSPNAVTNDIFRHDKIYKKVDIVPYIKTDTFICDKYTVELISTLDEVLDDGFDNKEEFVYRDGCVFMTMPAEKGYYSIEPNEFFNDTTPYTMSFNVRLMNKCLENIDKEFIEISTEFIVTLSYKTFPPVRTVDRNVMKIIGHDDDKKLCLIMPIN